MSIFAFYRVELRRLVLSKWIWVVSVLCFVLPLLGYTIYTPAMTEVMSGKYIANPVLAGAAFGGILWAVSAMLEADRLHRSGADVLTDAIASPIRQSVARVAAMMTISAAVTAGCSLIYLPFTAGKMEYLFSAGFYLLNFFVLMMPTWWISLLFAEGLYQITCRTSLSVLLYAALAGFSFSGLVDFDYFRCWLCPFVVTYSDGFTTLWPLRINLYTRAVWLFIALGLYMISLLCIRRYQKNLVVSFVKGLKKVYIPVCAVLSLIGGMYLRLHQPFVDKGTTDTEEYMRDDKRIVEHTAGVLLERYNIKINTLTGVLSCRAEYSLGNIYTGESRLLLNPGYKVKRISYDGEDIAFRTLEDDFQNKRSTVFTLPDVSQKLLIIEYEGLPMQDNLVYPQIVNNAIDPGGIFFRSSSLIPAISFGGAVASTMEITIPARMTPFLEYERMTDFRDNDDGTKTWTVQCAGGMYYSDFMAADYQIDSIIAGETKLDFAYGKSYQEAVEKYGFRQSVEDVVNYCSEHYGRLSYMVSGKTLTLLQSSALEMGGWAGEGYSTFYEVSMSPETLSEPEKGANATEVFIHELIHQWWGGLGLNCVDDGLWSTEGLTVYSTYRLVKEKYGALYAKQYYTDEWEKAVKEQNREFYYRHPEYLERLPEQYQNQLKAKNESVNHYMRMPLMILKAEQLVGGEEKMDAILKKMYESRDSYSNWEGAPYEDFLEMSGLSEEDLVIE